MGHIAEATHFNGMGDVAPVRSQPYRAVPAARGIEKAEVGKMLNSEIIEPSSAEWSSPVVLIPKPDSSLSFRIDYRQLNDLTKKDIYPVPRLDEFVDSYGEVKLSLFSIATAAFIKSI